MCSFESEFASSKLKILDVIGLFQYDGISCKPMNFQSFLCRMRYLITKQWDSMIFLIGAKLERFINKYLAILVFTNHQLSRIMS
jgi:hypothetical protein